MNSNNVLELTQILEDALCGDTVRRQKAEADITQLAEANFNLFLLSLSMKISNESEPNLSHYYQEHDHKSIIYT